MKRFIGKLAKLWILGMLWPILPPWAMADTTTTNTGLVVPDIGSTGWGTKTNNNWNIVDSSFPVLSVSNTFTSTNTFNQPVLIKSRNPIKLYDASTHYIGLKSSAVSTTTEYTLPAADGTSGQALITNGSGALSFGNVTGGGVYPATATASFPFGLTSTTVTVSGLSANQCVQTGSSGQLTTTGSSCSSGSGSSSSLQVTSSGVQITSPTSSINFLGNDFGLTSVGTTSQIILNPATTNYIHNQTTLQSATLFVASGTFNTELNTSSITFRNKNSMMKYVDKTTFLSMPDIQTMYMGYGSAITPTSGGTFNTCYGAGCMSGVTTGNFNTGVGNSIFQGVLTGDQNNCVGYASCNVMAGGSYNNCMGGSSCAAMTTANDNTVVGTVGMAQTTTGSDNVAIGFQSQQFNTTGAGNSSLGYWAGTGTSTVNANRSGNFNTYLGYQTGQSVSSSTVISNSIAIGRGALFDASGVAQIGGRNGTGVEVNVRASSFTIESIASGQCLQTGTGGRITGTGAACSAGGGGGSSSLQVTKSGVEITSPTASINFLGLDFGVTAIGTTSQVILNPATTNYIHNQTTPQTATANISSGTISVFNSSTAIVDHHGFVSGTIPDGSDWGASATNPAINIWTAGNGILLGNNAYTDSYYSVMNGSATLKMGLKGSNAVTPYGPNDGYLSVYNSISTFYLGDSKLWLIGGQKNIGVTQSGGSGLGMYVLDGHLNVEPAYYNGSSWRVNSRPLAPIHVGDGGRLPGSVGGASVAQAGGAKVLIDYPDGGYFVAVSSDTGAEFFAGANTAYAVVGSTNVTPLKFVAGNSAGPNYEILLTTGGFSIPSITSGQCLQTGANGLITGTGAACGSGGSSGASALAVSTGTTAGWAGVSITSPTAAITFDQSQFYGVLAGGTTAFISIRKGLSTPTANFTFASTSTVALADASGGSLTVTLPTAVGITGKVFTVKRVNSGSNTVTIGTTSSQTIDGVTTQVLTVQYTSIDVISDGSGWNIL